MLSIDRSSGVPLYRQVYLSLRQSILAGVWEPGEKIPSIRNLMADLGISRNTVVNALQQLVAEGYVESRHGAGYFVSDISFDLLRNTDDLLCPKASAGIRMPDAPRAWTCDFSYGDLREGTFPLATWRKLAAEALCEGNVRQLTSYGSCGGDLRLRHEIARYLERSRGVSCTASQVFVTSGVQESIANLLRLFDADTDAFAMENPGFFRVRQVVKDAGWPLALVTSDAGDEALLSDIDACSPKLVYLTPSNQMPLGTYLTIDTRIKLLESAIWHDAYLIEDDYDSIYRFNVSPLPALKSLDRWGRVVYLGSFSKILSPALRMGFIVLPVELTRRYEERMAHYRCTVPWLEQEVLRLFIECGHMERHLRRIELDVRSRHRLLIDEIDRQMPGEVRLLGRESGLHLLLSVRNGMTQEQLVARAREQGVRVVGTRPYWDNPKTSPDDLIMLGYSHAEADRIATGVRLLCDAWFPASVPAENCTHKI